MNNLPAPWTYNGFAIDDGKPQGLMVYGRGVLKNGQGIAKKQTISSVVAHAAGEIRTAARDSVRTVVFSGHVFAPVTGEYPELVANLDALKTALTQGPVGPLCLWDDGRYVLAELVQFDDGISQDGGEPNHCQYIATFLAYDPYAYGALTQLALLTNATLTPTGPGSTLYVYRSGGVGAADVGLGLGQGWPPAAWPGLGSASSALTVAIDVRHSNGLIKLAVTNGTAQPAQTASLSAAPFLDGDRVVFDGPGAAAYRSSQGVTTGATTPVGVLTLNPSSPNVGGLTIAARSSGGSPVLSVTVSYLARYF